MATADEPKRAVDLAPSGDWDAAHAIAQRDERDPVHRWLHAVLHKIEGDDANSRYWYRGSGREPDAFASSQDELQAIRATLDASGT